MRGQAEDNKTPLFGADLRHGSLLRKGGGLTITDRPMEEWWETLVVMNRGGRVLSEPEPRIRENTRRAVDLFLTTYDPTLYIGEQIAMYYRTDDGREGSHQGGKQAPGATHQVETVAARACL